MNKINPIVWVWITILLLLGVGPLVIVWVNCPDCDDKVEVDLLQVNDVYEVGGLNQGSIGGMARVSSLKKQLRQKNSNVLLLMAGDFISPSVFNNVKQNGASVAGKQMIEAMNAAGFDLVIFGNHEFDFKYNVLQQRIDESQFQWVASNVMHTMAGGTQAFKQRGQDIPPVWKKTFSNAAGCSVTIGFFGLTIPVNRGDSNFATYTPSLETARRMYKLLSGSCDAVIAITHQNMADDRMLADSLPELAAIIGGHEHDMQFEKRGNVFITKAHANAKSAYELKLVFEKNKNRPIVTAELVNIDSVLPRDPLTAAIADKWMGVARDYFKGQQITIDSPVCAGLTAPLDGRDDKVRSAQTNLSLLITNGMLWATRSQHTQLALLNSGSIRVDDIIVPPVTEYSFLRALPYGGAVRVAELRGWFLTRVLDSAAKLAGDGAFLQYSGNVGRDAATQRWAIDGSVIKDSPVYKVAIADYLIEGKQNKLNFIQKGQPGVDSVYREPASSDISSDIVKATIASVKAGCH